MDLRDGRRLPVHYRSRFPTLFRSPRRRSTPTSRRPDRQANSLRPPLFAYPRRLPPDRLNIARCDFDRMQKQGICRPSSSSWVSPLFLVPRKDGSYRPCGDYRRLNSVTVPDRYPLSYLHNFTANLTKKTNFTKLDLVRAYNQVPIAAGDVHKTADSRRP